MVDIERFFALPVQRAQPSYAMPPRGPMWLFEAGLPDPAVFPVDDLVRISEKVLREDAAAALQYGPAADNAVAAGHAGLRDVLAERTTTNDDRELDRHSVMLTAGAAQGLMLAFEALVDAGDAVAVESPVWNAILAALGRRGADIVSLPIDEHGLCIDTLELELTRLAASGRRLKFVYTIATFNTPTGRCLSLDRRCRLLALAEAWDFLVIEDNVYGSLRYDGDAIPTLFALDRSDRVVKVDSFSKVMAPGLRLGWLTATPALIEAFARIRGDLGVSQWIARVVEAYVKEGLLDTHIATTNTLYRAKRDAAEAALREHCEPWVHWRTPAGGFFLWVGIDPAIDGAAVMERALANGVLVRPGEQFFAHAGDGRQYFRLAFPAVPIPEIDRGIAVLGTALRASLR